MLDPANCSYCFDPSQHGPICVAAYYEDVRREARSRCLDCNGPRGVNPDNDSICTTCYAKRMADAQTPSPRSCQFCFDGDCLGNPWCHCRDGINYGQIFAEGRAAKRKLRQHSAKPVSRR